MIQTEGWKGGRRNKGKEGRKGGDTTQGSLLSLSLSFGPLKLKPSVIAALKKVSGLVFGFS
jgi:hypothetical protein